MHAFSLATFDSATCFLYSTLTIRLARMLGFANQSRRNRKSSAQPLYFRKGTREKGKNGTTTSVERVKKAALEKSNAASKLFLEFRRYVGAPRNSEEKRVRLRMGIGVGEKERK